MAGTPSFTVYSPAKEYVAAATSASDAAAVVSFYGEGATVRWGHGSILWTEGKESTYAGESYDGAADCMLARLETFQRKAYAKAYAKIG